MPSTSYSLEDLQIIGPLEREKLQKEGISNAIDLLVQCKNAAGRRSLAEKTEIPESLLIRWCNRADLMRISGVGSHFAEILERGEVHNIIDLQKYSAHRLQILLEENNDSNVQNIPNRKYLSEWIKHADNIPKIIDYDEASNSIPSIADSFIRQSNKLRRQSGLFIWAVIFVVLGGVALALALPPLISRIDRFISDFDPPSVVQKLQNSIEARSSDLENIIGEFRDLVKELNSTLQSSDAVWAFAEVPELVGTLSAVIPRPNDGYIGVGSTGDPESPSVLIVSSDADGRNWEQVETENAEGEPILGRLQSIHTKPGGGYIAFGTSSSGSVLILYSDGTGKTWTSAKIAFEDDIPSRVRLGNVISSPENGLVLVGSAGGFRDSTMLILRSDVTGEAWEQVRTRVEGGEPFPGFRLQILRKPDGGLIAFGHAGFGDRRTVIAHSDGFNATWKLAEIVDQQASPLRTIVSDIIPIEEEGEFLAVGTQPSSNTSRVLILRSNSAGDRWAEVELKNESDGALEGHLTKILPKPGGGFIAVGRIGTGDDSSVLILHGDAMAETWTPVTPSDNTGRPISGIIRDIHPVPEGGFIAVGTSSASQIAGPLLILRSDAAGQAWEPVQPVRKEGAALLGTIWKIVPAAQGGFIAIGASEIAGLPTSPLLLRSGSSGRNWATIEPSDQNGNPISGNIRDIVESPGDGFIAVGSISGELDDSMIMILESRKYKPSFSLEGSLEEESEIVAASIEVTIKKLGDPHLLLPLTARGLLPQARDLGESWNSNLAERESLRENHTALSGAWNDSQIWQRVSRIVTRVAVIALLIYLVQIMVNLYRYTTRLAAFYQARGDALLLADTVGDSKGDQARLPLDELVKALSPDNLDFGKSPAPPTQQLVDFLRDAAKAARSPQNTG